MKKFYEVVKLVKKLRGKNGCPWDKQQTIASLKEDIISEAGEVEEAINKKDYGNLKEELGDLLWSILLTIQIAKEEKLFDILDVLETVKEKIIRRHPHVFGNLKAKTPEDARRMFYEAKAKEKCE